MRDPLRGILAGSGLSSLMVGLAWGKTRHPRMIKTWLAILLTVLGLGVSVYLASVETTRSTCICCLVGCREDAHVLNLLPIGLLGAIGYGLISIIHRLNHPLHDHLLDLAWQVLFGILSFGYFLLLEPLVLGPRCIWCFTATVIVTAGLWLITAPSHPVRPQRSAMST